MKKATLEIIYGTLKHMDCDPEILEELEKEINKGAEAKAKNAEAYEQMKPIVLNALATASAPVTMGELYDAIKTKLPTDMTKGKLQYAVTRLWTDEILKIEGSPNTYQKA